MIDLSKLDLNGPEPTFELRQVTQPMGLATTRYQNWRESTGHLPVGITVGRPRFVRFSYETIPALAPFELMRGPLAKVNDVAIERKVYFARLKVYESEILAALQELARRYPDTPACLMCFEDVNGGEACHREWAAEWFGKRFGWTVPELPDPADAAPKAARKPTAPKPDTLF
ncbi:hypothetical protein GCM10010250_22020 [Streptomyces althioticus]|uniref:hypothetical protein n=1 Tax=Streptomyces althioticus TaxID=83380 RepID=UPI0018768AF3|nr:hypothetical protein GCM10010250_22020 [Streptomyces althioticus]